MLSRAYENKLKWISDAQAQLQARRQLIRLLALRDRLHCEGYRLLKVQGHLRVICRQCGWMRNWPIPRTWRRQHSDTHDTREGQAMKQTKQQRAATRRAGLAAKRQAQCNANGFELVETETGLSAQCMTCGQSWQRLSPMRQEQHRAVCAPDPQLSSFTDTPQ